MKSPHQFRAKSTPKPVTFASGVKMDAPMARSRKTPSDKTGVKIYPQNYKSGI